MKRFIYLSVSFVDTGDLGFLVKEIWLGDLYHSRVSFEDYAEKFPEMKVALEHAAQLNWGGSFDRGMLDSAVQQLILQLNSGELCGIITTPDMLDAFCEFLMDFNIESDKVHKILSGYIIADVVAKRLT